MALVYSELGSMQLERMARLANGLSGGGLVVLTGLGLVTAAVGFKLALVPFHMWTPDVYQGAPAPVTAYLATVSKGAMLALVLRYFLRLGAERQSALALALVVLAAASMLAGNLLALMQRNLKRLLAYSSIAHLGYMLVALVAAASSR